jgi:hypothetical protein
MEPGGALTREATIASASGAKAMIPIASHAAAGCARDMANVSAAHAMAVQVQIFMSILR